MKEGNGQFMQVVRSKIDALASYFNVTTERFMHMGVVIAISFGAGFLFKKYGREFLIMSLIVLVSLLVLSYYHIINVDWDVLKSFFGLQTTQTIDSLVQDQSTWIREHVGEVVTSVIGFIAGYMLG